MMNQFDWQSHLNDIYSVFPESKKQPVIGITGNFGDKGCELARGYYESVITSGGIPMIIPPSANRDTIVNTLQNIDGLLLSGGSDINPLFLNEEPSPKLHGINSERDLPELLLINLAYNRQIPILGICRGIQMIACALGGKIYQDIINPTIKHSQELDRNIPSHSVNIDKNTILSKIYQQEKLWVNSFHHQAVSEPGKQFKISATAPDGTIEAIESCEFKSIIGVQWHPECLTEGKPLFDWLVTEASNFSQAKKLHKHILSLDTHCDTPMFFPQGIHFDQRDPRILVDLQKMNEGHQDATIMVAYLPQPKLGETFSSKVQMEQITPFDYADLIFDKIEKIVSHNSKYISIARTPFDLYEDKRHNRKSIMFGIENALALNGKISNLKHFATRGVVYITLCHNGDNDICDSARGCNTHDGVSQFGANVIREMNNLGMMVDLSHGSEKSFYDALEISNTPIICSHSSCRALCDVPRDLTDEQLIALKQHGGVAQMTLYHGFLRKDGQATIEDFMAHLNHAINIMGIDYVGIGTDFDGDGGIPGLANSSELINFTRELLKKRYNEIDIQKIWGGNFLRIMSQVQNIKR
jgi:membrane dipeptidase